MHASWFMNVIVMSANQRLQMARLETWQTAGDVAFLCVHLIYTPSHSCLFLFLTHRFLALFLSFVAQL